MCPLVKDDVQEANVTEWFDSFVSQIRFEELKLSTNLADKQTKDFFQAAISNDIMKVAQITYDKVHQQITTSLVGEFLYELFIIRKADICDIAFDLSGNEVLVWAVVNDNDDKAETDLFLSESVVNAKYQKHNYNISVTALEKSDNIEIPSQYSILKGFEKNAR